MTQTEALGFAFGVIGELAKEGNDGAEEALPIIEKIWMARVGANAKKKVGSALARTPKDGE